MARKKRHKSPVQREYTRVRRNFLSKINRRINQGFYVDVDIPAIPKRITKASIRRLEKITTATINAKTFKLSDETGEPITYRQAKAEERKRNREAKARARESAKQEYREKQRRASNYDVVTENFQNFVNSLPRNTKEYVSEWFAVQKAAHSKHEIVQMLEESKAAGIWAEIYEAGSDMAMVMVALDRMLTFLNLSDEQRKTVVKEYTDLYGEEEMY